MVMVATALVMFGEECILVSRKDNHSDFGLPGGKVEPGETLQEAVVREVYEETGVKVKIKDSTPVFKMEYRGNPVETFLIRLSKKAKLKTDEAGVVRWGNPTDMLGESSFADYNVRMLNAFAIGTSCPCISIELCEAQYSTDSFYCCVLCTRDSFARNTCRCTLSSHRIMRSWFHKEQKYIKDRCKTKETGADGDTCHSNPYWKVWKSKTCKGGRNSMCGLKDTEATQVPHVELEPEFLHFLSRENDE